MRSDPSWENLKKPRSIESVLMLRDYSKRVIVAFAFGLVGAALGLAFYCVFLIDFLNIVNFQGQAFLAAIRLDVILGTICGLVAFLLTRGYECVEPDMENRRRLTFLLGVLEMVLMGWLAIVAILAWVGLL